MILIDGSLQGCEGIAKTAMEGSEQSGTEGKPEEIEIKVLYLAPGDIGARATFGDEAVDVM